jgi:hypothetical protein
MASLNRVRIGHTFGSRTIVSEVPYDGHAKRWSVQCACGHVAIMPTQSILKGYRCRACWVYPVKHGHNQGSRKTRIYRIWGAMIQRTTNPKSKRYADYGGRGSSIEDERWFRFENFLADMGECPDGLTLERFHNSIGYLKDNCGWKPRKHQSRNTRQNRMVEYQGRWMCLMDATRRAGVNYQTTRGRMRRWNCSFEQSLVHPRINMKCAHLSCRRT